MTASPKRAGIDFSDALRAYAGVSVVMLHVLFSDDWKYHGGAIWWIADIVHAFAKPAVPLFVMLSGAFLLDPAKEFSIGKFWLRRASRVLVPFLAWSVVYAAWYIWHDHAWTLAEFPGKLLRNGVAMHLWFVYMLMGLYLALPILRRFVAGATRTEAFYFMGLWFVVVCVVPLFPNVTEGVSGYLVVATGFTGYFAAGYWLWKTPHPAGRAKALLAGAALVALCNAAAFHFLAARSDVYLDDDDTFLGDLGPTVAILSFLVFASFRALQYDRGIFAQPLVARATGLLSSASYGLYLGHPFVFIVLGSGLFFGWKAAAAQPNPWIGIPLLGFEGVAGTLVLLLFLSRIPLLRALAPMTPVRRAPGSK